MLRRRVPGKYGSQTRIYDFYARTYDFLRAHGRKTCATFKSVIQCHKFPFCFMVM